MPQWYRVVWTDVATLIKILKDISTNRQIAATLSGLPAAAPRPVTPRLTLGPQDLPQVQPQQNLLLSYWAILALTG